MTMMLIPQMKTEVSTKDLRYNNTVCYQRFCCQIEFAEHIKKLDVDPSKA